MTSSATTIWTVIILLGLGTFALRFSFLGILGQRPLPGWLLRHLRYTPVAVIPGLMAAQVFVPLETGGLDLWRVALAGVVVAVGAWTRSAIWAIVAGVAMIALIVAAGAG
jgi:branched-subunit amino acid transport protein